MTDIHSVLAIRVAERQRLVDVFGEEAIDRALSDFGDGMRGVVDRLLSQHDVLDEYRWDDGGGFLARFRIPARGLPRDAEETCAAIEAAGRKLMHDQMSLMFGAGTGQHVAAALHVFPLEGEIAARLPADLAGWVDETLPSKAPPGFWDVDVSADDVAAVLAARSLVTAVQPIVRMADRAVIGYEALTRGPAGSPLERPDVLFSAARVFGFGDEIEILCAELALERTRGKVPDGAFLTVNLGPDTLARAVRELALDGRGDVIFELTEHLPLGEAEALADAVRALRGIGVGVALDDTGCGFADLDTAKVLSPEIVKLCVTVVRNADKGSRFIDPIRETTNHLLDLGCRVLAEGVETEEQHRALGACGIELAQGWLYARPAPVDTVF